MRHHGSRAAVSVNLAALTIKKTAATAPTFDGLLHSVLPTPYPNCVDSVAGVASEIKLEDIVGNEALDLFSVRGLNGSEVLGNLLLGKQVALSDWEALAAMQVDVETLAFLSRSWDAIQRVVHTPWQVRSLTCL